MACGCGAGGTLTPNMAGVRTGYTSAAGQNGVYVLHAAPECHDAYDGVERFASVLVVGLGVEGEQIFRRTDSKTAIAYAKETQLRLEVLSAHALCGAVMTEFFGG